MSPDRQLIREFLGLGVDQLVAIPVDKDFPPHWPVRHVDGRPRDTIAHAIQDLGAAVSWAAQWNAAGANLYWSANQPATLWKKPNKFDVIAVRCLFADDDSRRLGQVLLPPPTLVIDSGGGLQPVWVLEQPVEVEGDPDAIAEYERHTRWIAQRLDADDCWNADRVLRLPGTVNWPNAVKRARGRVPVLARLLECHPERRYRLDQFGKADPLPAAKRHRARIDNPQPIPPALLEDLVADGATRYLIINGRSANDAVREVVGQRTDRSRKVLAACCRLVRAGLDDETIYSIITDECYRISDHVLAHTKPDYCARRTIERARSLVDEVES